MVLETHLKILDQRSVIVAMTKFMLEAQKLKKSLWTEAMANAVYTLN